MRLLLSILVRVGLTICPLATTSIYLSAQPDKAQAKKEQFVLVKLEGRKPLANRHLVIFVGQSVEEARSHANRMEAETDARGVVTLSFDPRMRWFQIWHEVGKQCPGSAGERMVFHSNVLRDEGALVLDTCGPTLERLQPYLQLLPPVVEIPSKR